MDRFWVLERSVDIESADFLIQRRLIGKRILDEDAPRFGVVQAKFSQDERTVHRLACRDILDKDGNPHREFFLIIHTGDEEHQQMFLLTAKDVSEDFHMGNDSNYQVSSRAVFASPKYLVRNRKSCLDRIENSIQCAEFYKNRSFVLSRLDPLLSPDFEAILPEYREKIDDYYWRDIPAELKEIKEEAFGTMLHIREVYSLLNSFVESVDPVEAIAIAETLHRQEGRISLPHLFKTDLYYDSKNFMEKVQSLRSDGILDNYISARKGLVDAMNSFLQSYPTEELTGNSVHQILVEYDPVDLRLVRVTNTVFTPEELPYDDFGKIIEAKEGRIVLSWKIGRQYMHDGHITLNTWCIHEIMQKIYALKYYEDEEIGVASDRA